MADLMWIRHNLDAADGRRFTLLRLKAGYEAHGFYWAMLKPLYKSSNCYPFATAEDKQILASALHVDVVTCERLIDAIIECNLLQMVDGCLVSERISEELEDSKELTKKRKKAGSLGGQASAKQRHSKRVAKSTTDRQTVQTVQTDSTDRHNNNGVVSEKVLIGNAPNSPKDKLPKELQDFFISRGKVECFHNVFLSEEEYKTRTDKHGIEAVEAAIKEMSDWSISLDISTKTNVPGWKSYRQKRDHAKTLDNLIKRRQAA